MSRAKLEEIQGKFYFRCQFTGALSLTRYGIPSKDGSSRRGVYKDAAVAIAHIDQQFLQGKIEQKKRDKIILLISKDLSKKAGKVMAAPMADLDPLHPTFAYLEKPEFKQMLSKQFLIDIDKQIQYNNTQEGKIDIDQKVTLPQNSVFYTVKPTDQVIGENFLESEDCVEFKQSKEFSLVTQRDFKRKKLVIIHGEQGEENRVLNQLFPHEERKFRGTCYIAASSKIHKEEKEKKEPQSKKRKRVDSSEEGEEEKEETQTNPIQ